MKLIQDITYVSREEEDLHLDLYLPASEEFDIFVFFHGGGLERGSKANTSARLIGPWLSERGVAVASCDYSKYPNAKYPDFIEDAASAVKWVKGNISTYGKCEGIYVGGSSAGGYLSMMLCFDRRWLNAVDIDLSEISGYFHDAGQPTAHFNVLKYSGTDSRRDIVDETAPLYHIGLQPEYPKMAFIVSDNDMKNRYEQTMLVLGTLRHFGYDMDKVMLHEMHGTHTHYVRKDYDNGVTYANMIKELIDL
jgi:dipeptidyl aminopeptidase/acylaminoacyl peptidase